VWNLVECAGSQLHLRLLLRNLLAAFGLSILTIALGTVLTLFVVPTAYTLFARQQRGERAREVARAEQLAQQPAHVAGE